jgi:hypothetical protein
LLALKSSPVPPKISDLNDYIRLLVDKGFPEVAYYAWLQFLSPQQLSKVGLLFNGEFETELSGVPFDWTFTKGEGVGIKINEAPGQDADNALLLDFGVGRTTSLSVSQLVMLPPGQYEFAGNYIADIVSKRGLQWRISCQGQKEAPLAESNPVLQGAGLEWQDFSFAFTVPNADCPAQLLELFFNARWASEQFITGSVWFDNLKIDKVL